MHKSQGAIYYSDYLKLDQFLGAQDPLSRKFATAENPEAHEEMLFIVVHQAYELWFKQTGFPVFYRWGPARDLPATALFRRPTTKKSCDDPRTAHWRAISICWG